jgi:hypothetical protein
VNRGEIINKNEAPLFDALPWVGTDIKMEELPIRLNIAEIWRHIFQQEEQSPLQNIMIAVNAGNSKTKKKKEPITKKRFCLNLDQSCNTIDNQCGKIDGVQETLNLIVHNARRDQANKKGRIPPAIIKQLEAV